MAAYPLTLPAVLLEGYGLSPVEPVVRTDMEVGATRTRRRTRARNDVLDVSFLYTAAQFATFRTWFDDDAGAAGGANWFDLLVDIGDGVSTMCECRFKGVFKAQRDGMMWRVSAQLEVR